MDMTQLNYADKNRNNLFYCIYEKQRIVQQFSNTTTTTNNYILYKILYT